MKVAMLSPVPSGAGSPPQSGVAEYTGSLLECITTPVTVLAQVGAPSAAHGLASVEPTWNPDWRLPIQLRAALRRITPDLLHVQHEFNLYGGLSQGALLTALLAWVHGRGLRTVTTVHGVVAPAAVTKEFISRNSLPRSTAFVRSAFRVSYWSIAAMSDLLIVHHEYFRQVLVGDYVIDSAKVVVIPHGGGDTGVDRHQVRPKSGERNVLCLGFLTGYKLPELLVDVAESGAIPGAIFTFCVGTNPRIRTRQYRDRASLLERRVRGLGAKALWRGYVPDDELAATIQSADVIVLPYTECVSVSGISALAGQWNVPICYSRALRPLFGPSDLEFELSPPALAAALVRALSAEHSPSQPGLITWQEAAAATVFEWQKLLSAE